MENNSKKFPEKFEKFVGFFKGLPVDFSNPKVEIGKYNGRMDLIEHVSENLQSTIVTFGEQSQWELVIKYVSSINHELLKSNIINGDKVIDSIKEMYRSWGEPEETIKKWIEEDELELLAADTRKKYAIEWDSKNTPCDFEGYLVAPDLAVSLNDDLFQAIITPTNSEKIIILYGKPEQNRRLTKLTICSYNVFDFTEEYDNYGEHIDERESWQWAEYIDINCDFLVERIEKLKSIGIMPNVQIDIDFRQFLEENGLDNMYECPAAGVYMTKSSLIDKVNQIEDGKVK